MRIRNSPVQIGLRESDTDVRLRFELEVWNGLIIKASNYQRNILIRNSIQKRFMWIELNIIKIDWCLSYNTAQVIQNLLKTQTESHDIPMSQESRVFPVTQEIRDILVTQENPDFLENLSVQAILGFHENIGFQKTHHQPP